jgi:hypothetical protein
MRLEDVYFFAEHAIWRDVLQEVSLDAHLIGAHKPVNAFFAECLTLKGNKAWNDLVEDGDIVRKPKLQSVAQVIGFLDLALYQKLSFHQARSPWKDNNPFAFMIGEFGV